MEKNGKAAEAAAFAKLDDLLANNEIALTDTRYRIAKVAGYSPGGGFYMIVEKWLGLRRSAQSRPMPPIDPALVEQFQADLTAASSSAMSAFRAAIGSIASEIDRAADLRVADAEQRAAAGTREVEEILEDLEQAGTARAELEKRVEQLEVELASSRSENLRLMGRIEESDRTLDRLTGIRARAASSSEEESPVASGSVEASADPTATFSEVPDVGSEAAFVYNENAKLAAPTAPSEGAIAIRDEEANVEPARKPTVDGPSQIAEGDGAGERQPDASPPITREEGEA